MATVTRPAVPLPNPGDDIDAEQVRDWITNILSFLESTNIDEANVDLTGADGIVGKSTSQTITGLKTFESTAAAAGGVREVMQLGLDPASGTASDNDGGRITFYADDDSGAETDIASLDWVFTDTTDGSEDSRIDLRAIKAGTLATVYSGGYAAGVGSHTMTVRDAASASTLDSFILQWDPDSGTAQDNQGISLVFNMADDGGNQTNFATIDTVATDVSNGSEDSKLVFNVLTAGSNTAALTVDGSSVAVPSNLTVGGTLTLTGGISLNGNTVVGDSASDTLTVNSTITSNLIFTDNTYDIGASGATRPRDLHLSRNALMGGTLGVTGLLTATAGVTSGSNIVSDTDGTDDLGLTGTRWRYVYADDIAITNDLAVTEGGTGASTASAARTNLGVAIGSDVQAYDAGLADIAGLATSDGNVIVGSGSNWVAESGATARTSLGLGSIATQAADNVSISGGSLTGMTSYSGGSFSGTTGTFSGDVTLSKDAPYLIMTDSGTGGGTSKIAVDAVGSNHGFYFQADGSTNHVILESNGDFKVDADTLFVDASADRVGVNNASPGAALDVAHTGTSAAFRVYNSQATDPYGILIDNTGANLSDSNYVADFRVGGYSILKLNNSGQIAFAPNSYGGASAGNLTVKKGSLNDHSIRLEAGGTTSTYLEYRGYLGHSWYVDSTRKATLDATGLGVGTASPAYQLESSTSSTSISYPLALTNPDQNNASGVGILARLGRSTDSTLLSYGMMALVKDGTWSSTGSTVDANLRFYTVENESSAERLRINSNGTAFFYGAEASFGADTNNRGIVNYGSNVLALSTVQSGATYYDTVKITDGKVGVNISPQVDFHVNNASTNGVARISTSHSTSYAQLQLVNQSGNYWYQTITHSDNAYRLYNGSDRLILDASGNLKVDTDTLYVDAVNDRLGINQASPTASLTVQAAHNSLHTMKVENAAGNVVQETYIDGSGNGVLNIRNASGAHKMQFSTYENSFIHAGFNFGVGTSSPRCNLNLDGNNDTSVTFGIDNTSGGGTLDISCLGSTYTAHGAAPGEVWFYSPDNINIGGATTNTNDIKFLGGGSELMRITSGGLFGFGTASPVVQVQAHFTGNVGTEAYMVAQSGYYVGLHPNSANEQQHIDSHSNGSGTSSIYIGNEVIQTSSDIRAKKNITDYSDSALSVLDKARVVEFEYRPEVINDESKYGPASRGKYVGLIAQEMIEYARWAVNDGEGDPEGEHIWTAKYELMVPLLIKAVQELTQRVTELENN